MPLSLTYTTAAIAFAVAGYGVLALVVGAVAIILATLGVLNVVGSGRA